MLLGNPSSKSQPPHKKDHWRGAGSAPGRQAEGWQGPLRGGDLGQAWEGCRDSGTRPQRTTPCLLLPNPPGCREWQEGVPKQRRVLGWKGFPEYLLTPEKRPQDLQKIECKWQGRAVAPASGPRVRGCSASGSLHVVPHLGSRQCGFQWHPPRSPLHLWVHTQPALSLLTPAPKEHLPSLLRIPEPASPELGGAQRTTSKPQPSVPGEAPGAPGRGSPAALALPPLF